MYSGGRNEYNFARNFVLSKFFLMIVWIVSSDLNFSPNIWRPPFVRASKDLHDHKK
jgi:hypothetical protein